MRPPRYEVIRRLIPVPPALPDNVQARLLIPTRSQSLSAQEASPFEQGMAAYTRGDYRGAVRHFTTAINDLEKFARTTPVFREKTGNMVDMSPQPAELAFAYYNRGLSHDQLNQGRLALADFRRAAATVPADFDRTHLDERIRELSTRYSTPSPLAPKR